MFQSVMEEAITLVKELMQLDDQHEVMFLHGGASTQFFQVPMNLLNENEIAAYTDTDIWGSKAIKEARYMAMWKLFAAQKKRTITYLPKAIYSSQNRKILAHYHQQHHLRNTMAGSFNRFMRQVCHWLPI